MKPLSTYGGFCRRATLMALTSAFLSFLYFGNVAASEFAIYAVKPSEANSSVTRFDDPNIIFRRKETTAQQELVVFLPGTDGKPRSTTTLFTKIAEQGYRVIGLAYNDSPAIVSVCPDDPSPSCSATVRQKRIYGGNVATVVENSQSESIVNRLVDLLNYLDQHDIEGQWGTYLVDGDPNWSRIVLSGLSQGAGMAAYIAKSKEVARVVLFSSPWDYYGTQKQLAPWISEPSATPPERWFAEYHRRENTATLIAHAYRQLQIPPGNIRVFDLDLPSNFKLGRKNPFHGSTVKLRGYADQWALLFGHSP